MVTHDVHVSLNVVDEVYFVADGKLSPAARPIKAPQRRPVCAPIC